MTGDATSIITTAILIGGIVGITYVTRYGIRLLGRACSRLIYGKPGPAPELPITVYPTKVRLVIWFLFLTAICVGSLAILQIDDPRYDASKVQIVGIGGVGVSIYLAVSSIRQLLTRKPTLNLTINGLEAHFLGLLAANWRTLEWTEIEEIKPGRVSCGRSSIACINVTLRTGEILHLIAAVPRTSRTELILWLQEYLSRYGSPAKDTAAS